MAAKKKRKRYTPAQRSEILAAAAKQGLTAAQVQKKFGVTPVTYYSWRKKTASAARGGRRGPGRPAGGGLAVQVRSEVQARVREMLPGIVRQEVNGYLDTLFGTRRRGGRRS
jgi:transposase-like protein